MLTRHIPKKETRLMVQIFDILFIMVLCFVTLWATMKLRGKVLVGSGEGQGGLDYAFHPWSFGLVVLIFLVYLGFMLRHSERELKEMVEHVYGEPGEPAPKAHAVAAEKMGAVRK
jgi:hypothetical protein